MAKIGNSFKFTGELKSVKDGLRVITSEKNKKWSGKELSLAVKTDEGSQIVRIFGGVTEGEAINSLSKDKDEKGKYIKLKIPMAKRLDKDVIDSVANFKKFNILDRTFITEADVIDYIEANMIDLEGKKVTVTGKVELNVHKGKIYTKYYFQNIYEAKEDAKVGFYGSIATFITPNSIAEEYKKGKEFDLTLIEKDRKIPFTVYLQQYNSDKTTKETKPFHYIPMTVFITLSDKFDFKNESHLKNLKFKIGTFKVSDGIYELGWDCRFFRGSEKTEITMDDLTNFEKMQIENLVKTFDEIVKGKQGYGDYKEEIQLIAPNAVYTDGAIKTDLTDDNLEVLFYDDASTIEKPAEPEVIDDSELF